MWTNSSGVALLGGMAGALDTQCSQAFGSGEFGMVGLHFLRGCIILSVLCMGVLVLWSTCSRDVLTFFSHGDAEQVEEALPYVRWSAIGLWPSVMYRALSKWLQAQGLTRGPMVAATYGALLNPVLNYIFIFRWDAELAGAAIANSICWLLMLVILVVRTWWGEHHVRTLCVRTFTWEELLGGWTAFLKLGVPSAAIVCFEWWSWEMSTIIAARISRLDLAVHGVILNIGNLCVPCVSRTPVHRVPPHFLFTVMLKAVFGARRIEAVLTLRLRSFLSDAQVLHM
jgi:MATE family multidrug resistance protein